jgi:hypothetical protein
MKVVIIKTELEKIKENSVIAESAILATLRANIEATKTAIPLVIKEGNILYEIKVDGTKKVLRKIPASKKVVPRKFTLK